jgi:hypothetical protein
MISAVGQMLGADGVIISIVYLAAQIRSQRKVGARDECFDLALELFEQNSCRESRLWPRFGFVLYSSPKNWMARQS